MRKARIKQDFLCCSRGGAGSIDKGSIQILSYLHVWDIVSAELWF